MPTPLCLGYGRKSLVRRVDDTVSVDRQRDAIGRVAAERREQLIWFEDAEGHRSGRFETTRPDFMRLMTAIDVNPDVRSVVVYRIDRAGRSVVLIDRLIKRCQAKGISFISIVDGIDTGQGLNAGEIFRIQALAMVSEYQANRAADDMRDAVRRFKQAGVTWGYTPFGFERVGKGYDARLVPSVDAPTVTALMAVYVTARGYDGTAEAMNDKGYHFRNRHGVLKPFTAETVRTIVGNVLVYAGYVVQRKWRAKGARVTLVGEGSRLDQYAAAVEASRSASITPIIEPEVASAVIERRFAGQLAPRRTQTWIPLLTPIAYVGEAKLRADRGRFGDYSNWYHGRGAGAWIRADEAERQVLGVLDGLQFSPELRQAIRLELGRTLGDTSRDRAAVAIADANKRMAVLQEMRLDRAITREAYNAQYASIETELRRHQFTLAAPSRVDSLMDMLGDLGGMIRSMTRERQRRALGHLFERIVFETTGELAGLHPRQWARATFGELVAAVRSTMPAMPSTGIPHDLGIVWAFSSRIVVQSDT